MQRVRKAGRRRITIRDDGPLTDPSKALKLVVAAPREFPGRARTLPPDAYAQAWAQASGADLLRNAKDGAMQAPAIAR